MKLNMIALGAGEGGALGLYSYLEDGGGRGALTVSRETKSCWYIGAPPDGLPERFRKAEEYTLNKNQSGVYMFGRSARQLTETWNRLLQI